MRNTNGEGPLRPGKLARLAGVSTDTLRHYERKGILAPRRLANGYREYSPDALDRVRMVRRALSVGFTLDELARVLRIRDQGGAPCREVRAMAADKLRDLERQLRDLKSLRGELRVLLKEWDERLARTPRGKQARLLDGLPAAPAGTRSPRRRSSGSLSGPRRKGSPR